MDENSVFAGFFIGWLFGITAFPSLTNGNPTKGSPRCPWPLEDHGVITCVSHATYLQAVQRLIRWSPYGIFAMHFGVALSEVRRRSKVQLARVRFGHDQVDSADAQTRRTGTDIAIGHLDYVQIAPAGAHLSVQMGAKSNTPPVGWAVSGSLRSPRFPQVRWGRLSFIAALVVVNSVAIAYIVYVLAGNDVPRGNREVLLAAVFWGVIGSNVVLLIVGWFVKRATQWAAKRNVAL